MSIRRKSIGLAIQLAFMPAALWAGDAVRWTDDAIWTAHGGMSSLRAGVRELVYRKAKVLTELHRVGLDSGCRVAEAAIAQSLRDSEPAFRTLIVNATRVQFKKSEMDRLPWHFGPMGHRTEIVLRRARYENPQLFETLEQDAVTRVLGALTAIPQVEGSWRGKFSNWNFEDQGALPFVWSNACLAATSSDPDRSKAVFDGFHKDANRQ